MYLHISIYAHVYCFAILKVVTNSGRASTLAASDAATPTLRRIERAAIAAATPISYHSRYSRFLVQDYNCI